MSASKAYPGNFKAFGRAVAMVPSLSLQGRPLQQQDLQGWTDDLVELLLLCSASSRMD